MYRPKQSADHYNTGRRKSYIESLRENGVKRFGVRLPANLFAIALLLALSI